MRTTTKIAAVTTGITCGLSLTWMASTTPVADRRDALIERALQRWEGDGAAEREALRDINPEWDLMARTFGALALANLALATPDHRERYLAVVDQMVDATLAEEAAHGQGYFLLPYADRPFESRAGRSLFVDGEIALMLAARLLVGERDELRPALRARAALITATMREAPLYAAESYPNEGWVFCNTTALAALRLVDVLEGTDHSELARDWVRNARRYLTDDESGMLVSSFTFAGAPLDGPEGSSVWLAASHLLLVDEELAAEQYRAARAHLADSFLGFGYAKEWPAHWRGPVDIDSGPIIPGLDASPSSSGFAILAARAFEDDAYFTRLVAALDVADIALAVDSPLRAMAHNAVAESVILYGLTFGPLWQRARAMGA